LDGEVALELSVLFEAHLEILDQHLLAHAKLLFQVLVAHIVLRVHKEFHHLWQAHLCSQHQHGLPLSLVDIVWVGAALSEENVSDAESLLQAGPSKGSQPCPLALIVNIDLSLGLEAVLAEVLDHL